MHVLIDRLIENALLGNLSSWLFICAIDMVIHELFCHCLTEALDTDKGIAAISTLD